MGAPHQHASAGRAEAAAAASPPLGIAHFTGAYPGQAVVNGRPNRLRRAAHYARASHIAAQSGNTVVSEAWACLLKGLDLELGGVADRRQERVDCV
jgi:hypothetical protein